MIATLGLTANAIFHLDKDVILQVLPNPRLKLCLSLPVPKNH